VSDSLPSKVNHNTESSECSSDTTKKTKCSIIAIIGVQMDSAIAESKADNTTHCADHHETRCAAGWIGIEKVGNSSHVCSDESEEI